MPEGENAGIRIMNVSSGIFEVTSFAFQDSSATARNFLAMCKKTCNMFVGAGEERKDGGDLLPSA